MAVLLLREHRVWVGGRNGWDHRRLASSHPHRDGGVCLTLHPQKGIL